jgi:hypothetical protein
MRKWLWAGTCLLVLALGGCGRTPVEEGPPPPIPKTEVITNPDGTQQSTTTIPTDGK